MLQQIKKTYPRRYHPMLVSNSGTDERMDSKNSLILWETFDRLPEEIRKKVSSDQVAEKIKTMQSMFNLSDANIGNITLLIRQLFFGEVNISFFIAKITNLFAMDGIKDGGQVLSVAKFVQDEIINIKLKEVQHTSLEQVITTKKENLAISDALLKYPHIGEQSVTVSQIKLKYLPTPVRPSIKNWITDFHDAMGSGKHSTLDRGNFLFHSENGKKLLPNERQKIAMILKSLDDQTLLTVDIKSQTLVFGNVEDSTIRQNSNNKNTETLKTETPNFSSRSNPILSSAENVATPRVNEFPVATGNETIKNQQASASRGVAFSPNFLMKSGNQPQAQNFNVISRESVERAQNDNATIAKEKIRDEKVENFFQIPQSKPPIGSEHFGGDNVQPDGDPISETASEKNRDALSDDLLYDKIQEKNSGSIDSTQNSDFSAGSVSFSSAQKFAVEQNEKPVQKMQQTPQVTQPQVAQQFKQQSQQVAQAPVTQQFTQQPVQAIQPQKYQPQEISPFHIVPSGYVYEKKEEVPNNPRNIVDLKN